MDLIPHSLLSRNRRSIAIVLALNHRYTFILILSTSVLIIFYRYIK